MRASRLFRGAIGNGFNDWIRSHWSLSRVEQLQRVPRDFYKPRDPFELVRRASRSRGRDVRYTFSPTIQLSCSFNVVGKRFFEINESRVQQMLTMKLYTKNQPGEKGLATLLPQKSSETTRSRAFRSYTPHVHTLTILNNWSSSQLLQAIQRSQALKNTLPNAVSSMLVTILRTAQKWTSSLKTLVTHLTTLRQDRPISASSLQHILISRGPILKDGEDTHYLRGIVQKEIKGHTLNHSLVLRLTVPQIRRGLEAASTFFTTVTMNFAAPRGGRGNSESDALSRRIAQLVSSPSLTYSRRDAALSQGLLNAVRGLRSSEIENRAVAVPQLPSIEQLTNQVRQQLEREIRIEKERRGL